MIFDPNNKIIQLCIQGMNFEGEGKNEEAKMIYKKAWNESITDIEKFSSAHYLARQQDSIDVKLKWDTIALDIALKLDNGEIKGVLPSLYLNIGKCYEDLNDFENAKINYELANSFTSFLNNDGYGKMIKSGIENGFKRISNNI